MKHSILICLLCFPLWLSAQKPKQAAIRGYTADEVKEAQHEADGYFKSMNYIPALKVYERLVITNPKDAENNYKLGLCYLATNINKSKSVTYLEYAANANSKSRPKDVLFDLARAYHYSGLYDQALETFEKYRVEKKGAVDAKLKFNDWVEWSTNAKAMSASPVNCTFENLGKGINSNGADYRPLISANDSIVYFSSRRKGNVGGGATDDLGDYTADIYYFTQNDSAIGKAKSVGVNINTAEYDETMFLNMNGDRMLVYREGPETNGDIFIAELQGKQWAKPVSLGKDFVTKATETGACLSPDGLTLYFAAEVDGSKTGKDIYRCTRTETTTWGKPVRLGDEINTKGDEDNPYMWYDGKTLFFSSNGRKGMGGYDIYKAVMKDPHEGFSAAENIGYPLNSTYDDIGIAVCPNGKTIYLSAVRDSGMGDMDLYKVKLEKPITPVQMALIEAKGITNVGGPAKNAIVLITNADSGETVAQMQANDATGRFDAALPAGKYKIVLRHAKFGKCETEITVDPVASPKVVLEMHFQ